MHHLFNIGATGTRSLWSRIPGAREKSPGTRAPSAPAFQSSAEIIQSHEIFRCRYFPPECIDLYNCHWPNALPNYAPELLVLTNCDSKELTKYLENENIIDYICIPRFN